MKKGGALAATLALALWAATVWAGSTSKISGRAVDAASNEPLPGVLVSVVGTNRGAVTDDQGRYYIINLSPGSYTVKATLIGYQAVTVIDIRCNPDLTAKVNFRMRSSPIATEGVTVVAERPIVDKDLTATMRVIPSSALEAMPWDNVQQVVSAQSGVVRIGEELHVRGGRSDEVDYLIDGISVKDATEGYTGLLINTNALSELSLLTGVYNAEYGQAMSGVISASIKDGREPRFDLQYNGGSIFPEAQGRGYQAMQADWGRPLLGGRVLLFGAGEASRSGDWDPHREILPHQDRQDYSWLGKATLRLSPQIRIGALAARSRSQYGRYSHDWYYLPSNYRSDLRKGSLEFLSINHSVSNSAFYQLAVGRFWNRGQFGVRDTFWDIGRYWWEDVRFFDYWDNQIYYDQDSNLVFTAGYNPYGYDRTLFYRYGNYWQYRDRTSEERFLKGDILLQAGSYHQLKAGWELKWYRLDNFHLYSTAVGKPIIDQYSKRPVSQGLYLQDKVEYEGLVVNGGIRLQRMDAKVQDVDSALWASNASSADLEPKWTVSPRLGLSYVVSRTTTFHFGYGRFFQMPLFHQYYQYISSYSGQQIKGNILGNPGLKPPRTTAIEFGTVTELNRDVSLDLAIYYKEIKNLVSINYVSSIPVDYYQYDNIEQSNSTGLELGLRKHFGKHLTGSARYCLAQAKGTGSDPADVYERILATIQGESLGVMERKEMPLDFDQRNKLVAEISLFNKGTGEKGILGHRLMSDVSLNMMFHYGSGLPFTPVALNKLNQESPDPNSARYPASKQLDVRLAKEFRLGPVRVGASLEVLNLFDWDNGNSTYVREASPYEIYTRDWQPRPPRVDYTSDSPYYDAGGDANGDGVFNVDEQWARWDQFQQRYTDNPAMSGMPRLFRAGMVVRW